MFFINSNLISKINAIFKMEIKVKNYFFYFPKEILVTYRGVSPYKF